MSDPLLDTPIEPAHQALAVRLTLASVDRDADRIGQGLQEVADGGMPAALAVVALLSKHLGVSLLTAHGAERTHRPAAPTGQGTVRGLGGVLLNGAHQPRNGIGDGSTTDGSWPLVSSSWRAAVTRSV